MHDYGKNCLWKNIRECIAVLLLQCALFGYAYIVSKVLFKHNMIAFVLTGFRFLIGALSLSMFVIAIKSIQIVMKKRV